MAWLSGWDKRIKLIVDQTKIDTANLTWIPVTVFLTSTAGEEVFVELTTDAEYLKVAFTKADGTTELKGEMELFDVSEELGIFHVSGDGWVITHDADTDFYMYYDKDHADNTDNIGAINTAAGAAVWDGNFKLVTHMVDATTSTVLDSTSNNNDGTKLGANEPIEATAKVGQGQDFDGVDDYISVTDSASLDITTAITFECLVNFDAVNIYQEILTKRDYDIPDMSYGFRTDNNGLLSFYYNTGTAHTWRETNSSLSASTDYHLAFIFVPGVSPTMEIRVNGGSPVVGSWVGGDGTEDMPSNAIPIVMGGDYDGASYRGGRSKGIFDEYRLSNVQRSAAWVKGSYNSSFDTLLTYGAEETEEAEAVNAIFFGMNF